MAIFRFRAIDEKGVPIEGTMDESSAWRVTQKLQERGYTVSSVQALHADAAPWPRRGSRLTWNELQLVAEELADITRGNLPLAPAVRALAQEMRAPRLKAFFDDLRHRLERGATLDEAISGMEQRVPPLMISLVRAGEASGNLPAVLQLLADYSSGMQRIRHTLSLSLAYPIVTLVFAAVIILGLLYYVVPRYAEIFSAFASSLPAPTALLVALSNGVRAQPLALPGGIALLIGLFLLLRLFARRSETARQWLDALRLHLPALGHVYRLGITARFCRTFAMLLRARTSLLDALELAAAASGSAALARAVANAAMPIANGESVAAALRQTGFFGVVVCWLAATGEQHGRLEQALDNAAEKCERDLQFHEQWLTAFAAPATILLTGFIVGMMLFALYLPIFTLGNSIIGV